MEFNDLFCPEMDWKKQFSRLELCIMDAMLRTQKMTCKNFGCAQSLRDKDTDMTDSECANVASQALTKTDLANQETILRHLYKSFPDLEISVEERVNNPTKTQAAFYQNDGKSDYLFQLDPIDGTYCYKEGINDLYGIIGSVLQKTSEGKGKFVSSIIFYPNLDSFLIANKNGVFEYQKLVYFEMNEQRIPKDNILSPCFQQNTTIKDPDETKYSAIFTHDLKRLKLNCDEDAYEKDLYSTAEAVYRLINRAIPGFISTRGHTCDYSAAVWMAQQFGYTAKYATGEKFGEVPYGDIITSEGRKTPRDRNSLLVVGEKGDSQIKKYIKWHNS